MKFRIIHIVLLLAFISLIGIVVIYLSTIENTEIKTQLAKSLIQLLVILITGTLISQFVKEVDRKRRNSETLAVFRNEIRKRIDNCYQSVKSYRSKLRGSGITPELCRMPDQMSTGNIESYRCQMESINEVQLDLEKIWHEVNSFSGVFSEPDQILKRVKVMSLYFRKLVDEYECNYCYLIAERDSISPPSFKKLENLVSTTKEGEFKKRFCDRYSEVVGLILTDAIRLDSK